MVVTFKVNEVAAAPEDIALETSDVSKYYSEQDYELLCPDSHSFHPPFINVSMHKHKFVSAILTAFHLHLPLALRPQHFWLLILQAVARHVHDNSEKLRSRFVTHEGKQDITIRRDSFVLGAAGNDWAGVVDEFSSEIGKRTLPGTLRMLSPSFTNTTKMENVACRVTVMDVMQNYFRYCIYTLCGFPKITLEGSTADWRTLRDSAESLIQDKCLSELSARWMPALLPVLDRFVETLQNPENIDVKFWESMCKLHGAKGSGRPSVLSGWFNVFFPIVGNDEANPFCVAYNRDEKVVEDGVPENAVSVGVGTVPAIWEYFSEKIPIEFRAGFLGVSQDADGTIRPQVGMYIVNKSDKKGVQGSDRGNSPRVS